MSTSIFGLFASSPIKPLEKHADLMVKTVEHTISLLEGTDSRAKQDENPVFQLAREARETKNQLREHLPKSLFMPFDRSDFLSILQAQDQVIHRCKDIVMLAQASQLDVPEAIQQAFGQYMASVGMAVRQAHHSVNELDELLESGFSGREAQLVSGLVQKLDEFEEQTDKDKFALYQQLYGQVTFAPGQQSLIARIVDWLTEVERCSQQIAGALLLMLARA